MLEVPTESILRRHSYKKLACLLTFHNEYDDNSERTEIDAYICTELIEALISCKSTSLSWYFIRNWDEKDEYHFIYDKKGYKICAYYPPIKKYPASCRFDMAVKETEKKMTLARGKDSQQTHKAIWQLTRHIEAFMQNKRSKYSSGKILLPIIVTNAPLHIINYKDKDINENGELESIESIERISSLAFNFSKQLRWDGEGSQVVQRTRGIPNNKFSLFIVNIKYLNTFLKEIQELIRVLRPSIIC